MHDLLSAPRKNIIKNDQVIRRGGGGLILDCCTRQWHHYIGEKCMICGQLLAKILLKMVK